MSEDEDSLFHYFFFKNCPSSHNIIHHSRPRRRKDNILCHKIKIGQLDAEDVVFNLDKKPHDYYW